MGYISLPPRSRTRPERYEHIEDHVALRGRQAPITVRDVVYGAITSKKIIERYLR